MSEDIRPAERTEELLALLGDVPFEVHHAGDSDEEYAYLTEDNVCITVLDPHQDKKLFIDLDDEFTLTFDAFHCHYDPEDGYEEFVSDIRGILQNDICAATLYYGEEHKWLGSTCIAKADISRPIKEVFRFILKISEFKKQLRDHGGEARFCFWDPVDDRMIDIPRAQKKERM